MNIQSVLKFRAFEMEILTIIPIIHCFRWNVN